MSGTNVTLQANRNALPDGWLERIFARFEDYYGAKFLDMWRGTDISRVKATWSEKLSAYADRPEAIRYALDSLDNHPFPPTLPEFLTLCNAAPRAHRQPVITASPESGKPVASQEQVQQHIARITSMLGRRWAA